MPGRPTRNGRELTRADVLEAVEGVKNEVILRVDASDRLTEEKFKAVRGTLETARADVASVKRDVQVVSERFSRLELSVARMIGYGAGAGAVASVVITIVKMLLSH